MDEIQEGLRYVFQVCCMQWLMSHACARMLVARGGPTHPLHQARVHDTRAYLDLVTLLHNNSFENVGWGEGAPSN